MLLASPAVLDCGIPGLTHSGECNPHAGSQVVLELIRILHSIIQDSPSDWATEAGQMDKVYRNGLCNLATSMATNPKEGFFYNRNAKLGAPFLVEYGPTAHPKTSSVFYNWVRCFDQHAPLYKRGWVVQERYLSPRTIHFSRFPAFECRKSLACEAYQTKGATNDFRCFSSTSKALDSQDIDASDTWHIIVHEYSRCQLTKRTDKLIALSGVAKSLSSRIGGSYYGGIWSEWWLPGLLWQVSNG